MPQYLIHPKHPLRTLVYIVLALGLVVGGYLTFKASQMSTEGRSKAALTYKTYISWEFEGTDTEGWVGENLTNIKVGGGVLKGIVGGAKANPKLIHKKVSLDQGNKMFEISVAVAPAKKSKSTETKIAEPYTLNVIYAVSPDGLKKNQLLLQSKTDGQMNNLTARFPDIGKLDIYVLFLEFVNVKSDSVITIESIKVTDRIGIKPSSTPPPITPKPTGLIVPTVTPTPMIFIKTKSSLPGDCNGDGSVNAGDISAMVLELKDMQDTGNTNPLDVGKGKFKGALGCDVNYDRVFNVADQTALSLLISSNTKSSLPGDCNGDSVINDTDRGTLTKEVFDGTNPLEAGKGSIRGSLGCDANYDGSINAGDISAQTFLEL